VGYTPPYTAPPAPPKGLYGRGVAALRRYGGLRQRARADSMSWWAMKTLQGVVFGGGPFALGLALIVATAALDAGRGWAWLGSVLLLIGLGIMLRYALAPATCQWVVVVPENRFCVVEDADGYTAEYLEPGRWIVTWRWGAKVHDYVDFNAITSTTVIADVLAGSGPVMDMDVTVLMAFNPADAEAQRAAQLRKMTMREDFETLIARDVRDIVRKHFRLLAPDQQQGVLRNTRALEEAIADQLGHLSALGLTLASSRPVMVYVRQSSASPYTPNYRQAWPPGPIPVQVVPPPVAPTLPPSEPPVDMPPPTEERTPTPPPGPPPAVDDAPTVKDPSRADDPLARRRRRRRDL